MHRDEYRGRAENALTPLTIDEVDALSLVIDDGSRGIVVKDSRHASSSHAASRTMETTTHR